MQTNRVTKKLPLLYLNKFAQFLHKLKNRSSIYATIAQAIINTHFATEVSIFSISSCSSTLKAVLCKAFKLSSNCSTELTPTITDVTKLSFNSQAKAISAKVCPRRRATSFTALTLCITSAVYSSCFRITSRAIRELAGMPSR